VTRRARGEHAISRRQLLKVGLGAAGLVVASRLSIGADLKSPRRPNILFLMDDEHRGDCLGCDGNKVIRTPNMDRLAAEGAMFRRAYSSLPSCTPARASLLTGQSPWGHGMLGFATVAQRYPFEKPRLMKEGGYYAVGIGKMHFHPQRNTHGYERMILEEGWHSANKNGFKCDYQEYFAKNAPGQDINATGLSYNDRRSMAFPFKDELHATYFTAQTAIDFLNAYKGDQPFFLKVSFQRPHSPYDPPQRFMDLYKDADLPKAQVGEWAQKKFGSFGPPRIPESPRGNLGPKVVRNTRQGYYGAISFVDEQIGRLLDVLQKRGFLDNTLILFTCDHGEMAGDQHLWRKTYAYEGSARIPMIVSWGKDVLEAKRGQVLSQLVELRDVLPTFLEAGGIDIPASMEGKSLLGLIRGKTDGWRKLLDLEHGTCYWNQNVWTAITDGRFKYIYHAFDGEQQLFDLDKDPNELKDLAADPASAETLRQWRRRMADHLAVRGEPWVKNGDLGLRTKPILYGPNYPKSA